MLFTFLFTSTILSSVLSAAVPAVKFHGWYLDLNADQTLRQDKNLVHYEEQCQFKGARNSNGGCDFLVPQILFPKNNTCPTGYGIENNRCLWGEYKDPFTTFKLDGKWWFIAEKADKALRLSDNPERAFGLRDATCPDELGFSGKLEDGKCTTYASYFIMPEDSACPSGYFLEGSLCRWDSKNLEMLKNPTSLAFEEATPQ